MFQCLLNIASTKTYSEFLLLVNTKSTTPELFSLRFLKNWSLSSNFLPAVVIKPRGLPFLFFSRQHPQSTTDLYNIIWVKPTLVWFDCIHVQNINYNAVVTFFFFFHIKKRLILLRQYSDIEEGGLSPLFSFRFHRFNPFPFFYRFTINFHLSLTCLHCHS